MPSLSPLPLQLRTVPDDALQLLVFAHDPVVVLATLACERQLGGLLACADRGKRELLARRHADADIASEHRARLRLEQLGERHQLALVLDRGAASVWTGRLKGHGSTQLRKAV